MVNPCSYVLDNIIKNYSMEWIVVRCDGLSFILCSKIIDNYHIVHLVMSYLKRKTYLSTMCR